MAENICVFDQGMTAWAGDTCRCEACCITGAASAGVPGLVDDPNADAQREILSRHGLSCRMSSSGSGSIWVSRRYQNERDRVIRSIT